MTLCLAIYLDLSTSALIKGNLKLKVYNKTIHITYWRRLANFK